MEKTSKPVIHKTKPKKKTTKLEIQHPRLSREVDIFENDETAIFIPGSPGYRVARGRSGLGYLETQAELSRIQGVGISWLFNKNYHRTREPFVLLGMFLTGFFLAGIPLTFVLAELFSSENSGLLFILIINIPNFAFGFALMICTFMNLAEILSDFIGSFFA